MEVFIALLVFFAPYVIAFLLNRKKNKIARDLQLLQEALAKEIEAKEQLDRKYKPITDMESHINDLLATAEERARLLLLEADLARDLADREMAEAAKRAEVEANRIRDEANSLRAEARSLLRTSKDKAEQIERDSRAEAIRITDYAKKQAEEIAGSALEAKSNADLYDSMIRAMRNTIKGYEDEYIIPNHAVLDDLAQEYSYTEAGEQLKAARNRIRTLVKNRLAGDCDYVEPYRKRYAIHLVVDAFNGKTDSALAKVKHDNYGKIKQEIIDAFALVNHNGTSFRNARINQEYLDARLDELKWAVATHEIQLKEREEQRQIREQIREEDRAQREIDRAIKEVEKEERILQEALEKARQELSTANDEQRQQFEAQLAELEAKLLEAEARGQRAISMAQQTRRGHVYVISNIGSFGENIFKVGMTRRLEPLDRVKELSDASVPFDFDVHAMIYSDDAPSLEKELHRTFEQNSVNKVNPRKEFFRLPLTDIRQAVEERGLNEIHWTMKAEAAEYRETQSVAKKQQASVMVMAEA
jgi:hypothetical protein